MSRTSRTAAITSPARWGFELVDVFFGQVRPRATQTVVVAGDLLSPVLPEGVDDSAPRPVYKFVARENDEIVVEQVQVEEALT